MRTSISLVLAAVLTVNLLGCVKSSERRSTVAHDITTGISNPGANAEALAMESPVPLVPISRLAEDATSEQPSKEYLTSVSAFSYSTAGTILAATPEVVTWKIPKFSFGTQYEDLAPLLKAKGIEKAFSSQADFGALAQEAFVSKVIQETYILVDEQGAKAAAYTDIAAPTSAPGEPEYYEMILDRPFLFALYGPGDTLLFIGICNNPLEG